MNSNEFNPRNKYGDNQAPPPEGKRLKWQDIPIQVRDAVKHWLGSSVVAFESQPTGFSPGVACRVRTMDSRRVFVKAVGPVPNPQVPSIHQREAQIVAGLPIIAPVPRLLWSYYDDNTGWVVLVFEDIEGQHPMQPWQKGELIRVLESLVRLATALTPSPIPLGVVKTASEQFRTRLCGWQRLRDEQPSRLGQLDEWSKRHLEALCKHEAITASMVMGNTLLHFDLRSDNILLTSERVWFVDWPLACIGPAWVDVVFFAPSVTMQGGPSPEQIIAMHPACQKADPAAITAAVISVAGFFTHRALQPPPPGLPTVRAFQAAQGVVSREWVALRTGWS